MYSYFGTNTKNQHHHCVHQCGNASEILRQNKVCCIVGKRIRQLLGFLQWEKLVDRARVNPKRIRNYGVAVWHDFRKRGGGVLILRSIWHDVEIWIRLLSTFDPLFPPFLQIYLTVDQSKEMEKWYRKFIETRLTKVFVFFCHS